jgi:hypothetical protein
MICVVAGLLVPDISKDRHAIINQWHSGTTLKTRNLFTQLSKAGNIYALNVRVELIATKPPSAHWQYVMISFNAKFRQNLSINIDSRDRNSLTSTSKVWISMPIFMERM